MAEIDQIPAALHHLFVRVPEDIRSLCTPVEIRIRLEEVHELLAQADACDDGGRARSLRRRAEKMLTAMSPGAFAAEHANLSQVLTDARRRGDDPGALAALQELRALERAHPQPEADRYVRAAMGAVAREVEARVDRLKVPIPAPTGSRLFSRKRGRK